MVNPMSLTIYLSIILLVIILAICVHKKVLSIVEIFKLSPIAVLTFLLICLKLEMIMASFFTVMYTIFIAYLTNHISLNNTINIAIKNLQSVQIVFFILMFAYAMASSFILTGVGASVVNLSLKLGLNGQLIAIVTFASTSILSIATGTSWGTFAACAPIFLWLNQIVGGNLYLTIAALAGGSCFGDNLGLISDTTIVSSGIQGVEVVDRIKHQGYWSLFCFIITGILFVVFSFILDLPTTVGSVPDAIDLIPKDVISKLAIEKPEAVSLLNQLKGDIIVPLYMIIPLILVIVLAIKGLSTLICLFLGIIAAYILGTFAGTVSSPQQYIKLMQDSFSSAGSTVIIMMMWITAFGGIMGHIRAFDPLSRLALHLSKNVRQLMFFNGILSIVGNALLADEMAQIVTVGPIINDLVTDNVVAKKPEDIYTLKLRNATFSDALGVFGSQIIPWHVYLIYYSGIATMVYPLHHFQPFDFIKYNFMAFVAIFSILFLTYTGWDKFIPHFALPKEPEVKLKKEIKSTKEGIF